MRFTIFIGVVMFSGILNRFLPEADRLHGDPKLFITLTVMTVVALIFDILHLIARFRK